MATVKLPPATPDLDRALATLSPQGTVWRKSLGRSKIAVPAPSSAPPAGETTRKRDGDEMTKKTPLMKDKATKVRNITVLEGSDGSLSYRVQFRIRVKGVQVSKARTLSTLKTSKGFDT